MLDLLIFLVFVGLVVIASWWFVFRKECPNCANLGSHVLKDGLKQCQNCGHVWKSGAS